jgi:hypothetical protein
MLNVEQALLELRLPTLPIDRVPRVHRYVYPFRNFEIE